MGKPGVSPRQKAATGKACSKRANKSPASQTMSKKGTTIKVANKPAVGKKLVSSRLPITEEELDDEEILEDAGIDDPPDFSDSSSDASHCSDIDGSTPLCQSYCKKFSHLLAKYDTCLQGNNYHLVQRQTEFASIYVKFKRYLSKRLKVVKKHRPVRRVTWDYMFQRWVAFGIENPTQKHCVPLNEEPKLNNWVKEQRRHFTNDTLKLDRFEKLHAEGFIFQPRSRISKSMSVHPARPDVLPEGDVHPLPNDHPAADVVLEAVAQPGPDIMPDDVHPAPNDHPAADVLSKAVAQPGPDVMPDDVHPAPNVHPSADVQPEVVVQAGPDVMIDDVHPSPNIHPAADVKPESVVQPGAVVEAGPDFIPEADVYPAPNVHPAADVHLAADVMPESVVQPGAVVMAGPDVMPEADVHPAPNVYPADDGVQPAADFHTSAEFVVHVLPEADFQLAANVQPEADVHPADDVGQPAANIHTSAEFADEVLLEPDVQPAANVQPDANVQPAADVNVTADVLLEAVVQPVANVISGDHHFMDGDITSVTDIPGSTICMDFVEGMPTTLIGSLDPFPDPMSLDTDKATSELMGNTFPDVNVKVDDDSVMSTEPSSMASFRGTVSGKLFFPISN